MNYQEAKAKAAQNATASNGDPHAYEIPFELGDYIKNMVGKKYSHPNGRVVEIVEWIGQNFVIKLGEDNYGTVPAMYHAQFVRDGKLTEVNE